MKKSKIEIEIEEWVFLRYTLEDWIFKQHWHRDFRLEIAIGAHIYHKFQKYFFPLDKRKVGFHMYEIIALYQLLSHTNITNPVPDTERIHNNLTTKFHKKIPMQ